MKERVVAILTGRGSRWNRPGRGGRRKRRGSGSGGKSSAPLSRRPLWSAGFQLGLQTVSFVTDIVSFFFSLQFVVFWPFKRPKRRRLMNDNIKKNWPGLTQVWPGGPGPGSTGFPRANSQAGFCLHPGRPGPGSTHRAGPGFKTLFMVLSFSYKHLITSFFKKKLNLFSLFLFFS